MRFVTEVNRIKDAKDAIRASIIAKGVSVPSDDTLDSYAEYIGMISIGSKYTEWTCDNLGRISSFTTKDSVTSIDGYAFRGYTSLTSVSMPSVTSIGNWAFHSCSSLTSVSMPNVTSIGSSAFQRCTSLASVSMQNVTSIGELAFYYCTPLTSVSMPNVTSIGAGTFSECSHLVSVDIGENITSIGSGTFRNCISLETVTCRATTPPEGGTGNFDNTPANLIIYVPAESVAVYKEDMIWRTYADKIQAIPQ